VYDEGIDRVINPRNPSFRHSRIRSGCMRPHCGYDPLTGHGVNFLGGEDSRFCREIGNYAIHSNQEYAHD